MSEDLYEVLTGEQMWTGAPAPPKSDVVTVIDCACGGRAGLVYRQAGHTRVWTAGYRHTRRGTAELLVDAALEDVEHLIRDAETAGVRAIDEFLGLDLDRLAALVPPLAIAARDIDVTGIAEQFRGLRSERPGVRSHPAGFLTECRRCRTLLDLADVILEVEPTPAPPSRRTVGDRPDDGPTAIAYDWPASARPRRVALYRQMTAVLASGA